MMVRFLIAVAVFVLAMNSAGAQSPKPLKLGVLLPLSGPFSALGQYTREGLELYLKEHGNKMGGRPVELVFGDDTNVPQVGLTQLRRLIEQEHAEVIFGPVAANVGVAVVSLVEQLRVPMIWPIVSDDEMTQRYRSEYVLRTGWTSSQTTHVLGDYAYKTLKYRKVATIGYDFNFGWQSIQGFVDVFQQDGGKITKQIWTPIVTTDYSPYLSALPRDVDAVMCSFSGTPAINFMKQYKEFGLTMPLICQGNATDESTLDQEGPPAIGITTALHYSAALDTPRNRDFVARFMKAYGHRPSYYGEGGYVAAEFLDKGLARVNGQWKDPIELIKVLRKVPVKDAPRGPIVMDTLGNPIENVYIRKVTDHGGKLENTVIKTYPKVSQFWLFDPGTYLTHPPYSRTYPPCNLCS